MISDEEKKAIEILKYREYDFDELYCTFRQSFIKPYDKSIGIILELIEKQSKQIEELKKPKYIIDCKTNEITKLTNDFVSKDKIKAILEEYKYTEIEDSGKIIEFYKKMQSLIERE